LEGTSPLKGGRRRDPPEPLGQSRREEAVEKNEKVEVRDSMGGWKTSPLPPERRTNVNIN